MPETSGTRAIRNGQMFENFVKDHLLRNGWTFIPRNDVSIEEGRDSNLNLASEYDRIPDQRPQKWFTTQFHLTNTIYENTWKVDFLLHDEETKNSLVIECKWQQSQGSVDEKYPYLVRNIKEKSPYRCLVLLDGDGYKPTAKAWLKREVDKKLIGVFSMSEFVRWFGSEENFFN